MADPPLGSLNHDAPLMFTADAVTLEMRRLPVGKHQPAGVHEPNWPTQGFASVP